ncbi:MAG: hypothetical protein GY820_28435 [Gammaproteobacteria bacterium]|nr:hypothetical protein [Gammaproteobacteria bacterium]
MSSFIDAEVEFRRQSTIVRPVSTEIQIVMLCSVPLQITSSWERGLAQSQPIVPRFTSLIRAARLVEWQRSRIGADHWKVRGRAE